MAEVIRIAESASEPAPQALPQNVEAEAALLGALMIITGWSRMPSSSFGPTIFSSRCTVASTKRYYG